MYLFLRQKDNVKNVLVCILKWRDIMFKNGTEWIKADFHLHTKADKEFVYSGEDDRVISDYVNELENKNIKLGVITNHNKFDLHEYRGLKKKQNRKA